MTLRQFISAVAVKRKQIIAYAADDEPVPVEQFETRNVTVKRRKLPRDGPPGFVVIRDDDGFAGSLSLDELRHLVTPPIRRPWSDGGETSYRALFEILDNTVFTSFEKKQMVAMSREIEERAWRVGHGTLRCGFQSLEALRKQRSVYSRLVEETDLDVHVYLADEQGEWPVDGVTAHVESSDEIGRTWLVVYDGSTYTMAACALIAEEVEAGRFRGFWTYDEELVDELLTYLTTTYE
ncbi:DICT sensory domain-containing protein [Haloprofundus salinisoli]|uniref:DICT sensory domain-containing protein n=1 Tax=Haloprofundus salinisoli TaxID=2876193 RepID=UPI001CCDDE3B|nr:DICT sensory domain-containing protein [Haloprofundus salinisoli]